MVKIVTLIGNNNRIYPALMSEGKPVRTLIDSKSGPMTFTPLENDKGRMIIGRLQENGHDKIVGREGRERHHRPRGHKWCNER